MPDKPHNIHSNTHQNPQPMHQTSNQNQHSGDILIPTQNKPNNYAHHTLQKVNINNYFCGMFSTNHQKFMEMDELSLNKVPYLPCFVKYGDLILINT